MYDQLQAEDPVCLIYLYTALAFIHRHIGNYLLIRMSIEYQRNIYNVEDHCVYQSARLVIDFAYTAVGLQLFWSKILSR